MVLLLPGISHPLPGKEPGQRWPGSLYFITSLVFGHLPGAAQRCQKAVYNVLSEHGCLLALSSCWLAAQLFVNFVEKNVFSGGFHSKLAGTGSRMNWSQTFQGTVQLGS